MADSVSPETSASVEPRYQIAGEGKELFSRMDLRERIRSGEIGAGTEIAREGTDEFRAAGEYPELARYFSLLTSTPSEGAGGMVLPTSGAPITSVAARLLPALIYPLTGVGAVIIVVLAFVETLPFGPIIGGLLTSLVGLTVVRASSEGSITMPSLASLGGPVEILMNTLKIVVLSILAAWPVILAAILMFVMPRAGRSLIIAALITIMLYYPACFAILAKWKTIRPALSVKEITNFITILGGDYFLALLSGLVVIAMTVAFGIAAAMADLPPVVDELIVTLPTVWGTLFISHLIGWAMYRHRDEL